MADGASTGSMSALPASLGGNTRCLAVTNGRPAARQRGDGLEVDDVAGGANGGRRGRTLEVRSNPTSDGPAGPSAIAPWWLLCPPLPC